MTDRGLILFPDGRVDEVDVDGNISSGTARGLYEELAAAGYPRYGDEGAPDCFDVSIDADGAVTAYTSGDGSETPENPMGAVTPRLALWLGLTRED